MKTKREQNNDAFQRFHESAKEHFDKLAKADSRHDFFEKHHSFYVVPGGANGGKDKCLVEVFYGKRFFDAIENPGIVQQEDGSSIAYLNKTRVLSERGAILRYFRTDRGSVIVTLIPASTENSRPIEDAIILDLISTPDELGNVRTLKAHWRSFMAYMQCTSIDGEPTLSDKIVIGFHKLRKRLIVDGKEQKPRVVTAASTIFKFALTVGLSGFILKIVDTADYKQALVVDKIIAQAKEERNAIMKQVLLEREALIKQIDCLSLKVSSVDKCLDLIMKQKR